MKLSGECFLNQDDSIQNTTLNFILKCNNS